MLRMGATAEGAAKWAEAPVPEMRDARASLRAVQDGARPDPARGWGSMAPDSCRSPAAHLRLLPRVVPETKAADLCQGSKQGLVQVGRGE